MAHSLPIKVSWLRLDDENMKISLDKIV